MVAAGRIPTRTALAMETTTCGQHTDFRFRSLAQEPGLAHLFSGRSMDGGGNLSLSAGRDRPSALAERARLSARLGISPQDWVLPGLVHGREVAVVGAAERGRGALEPETVIAGVDALLTATVGLPLAMPVGDCPAILLYGEGVLGVAHAGWRGLVAGVLARMVEAAVDGWGVDPAWLCAGVSPCAGVARYEIGPEVAEQAPEAHMVRRDGRHFLDLAGWAAASLVEAGLVPDRVEKAGRCTIDEKAHFFSHRREGAAAGRNGLLAVLLS